MSESPQSFRRGSRRRLLLSVATTGSVLLAGCLSNDDSSESSDDQSDSDDSPPGNDGTEESEEQQRPVSGTTTNGLVQLENAVHEYMNHSDIEAGALAVIHDGDVLAERGFGWADRQQTEEVEPDAVYRIGSLSKLFTNDVIGRLVESNDLSLDQKVLPLLTVEPPGGTLEDDRFEEVTVRHLLNHEGGWDRFQHDNPLFDPLVVSEALELDRPPERDDFIKWMLDTPLQFEPGDRVEYSNLGYVLLGHVIESVTGQSYQSVLEEMLLDNGRIDTVEIGRSRPENRHSDEIWYDDREQCPNVFDPNGEGSCADVGVIVEAFEAAGGHVADARSLAWALTAIEHVWISPDLGEDVGWHDGPPEGPYLGSLYGSMAYMRRPTPETTVVAVFNGRHMDPDIQQSILFDMEEAYEKIEWP